MNIQWTCGCFQPSILASYLMQDASCEILINGNIFVMHIHVQYLRMKALRVTGTKCLHFSPCCSYKAFCVDKFGEKCQTSAERTSEFLLPSTLCL